MSSGFSGPSDPLHARALVKSSSRKLSSLPRRTRPTSVFAWISTSIIYRIINSDRFVAVRKMHRSLAHFVQRLIDISNDVVSVFDANRNPYQSIGNAQPFAYF